MLYRLDNQVELDDILNRFINAIKNIIHKSTDTNRIISHPQAEAASAICT